MTITNTEYHRWLTFPDLNESERLELIRLAENPQALATSFSTPMSFGTAGLRGMMGVGPSRMNRYTVAWATAGVAHWLKKKYPAGGAVIIARDNRLQSDTFAQTTAAVLVHFGFDVCYWDDPVPTPVLSWSVPVYNAIGGIVITASHNPAAYNGYKVYDATGCQLLNADATRISDEAACYVNGEKSLSVIPEFDTLVEQGAVTLLSADALKPYIQTVLNTSAACIPAGVKNIQIVYSPLHGTGGIAVPVALQEAGFAVASVEEQLAPDGHFPTLIKPNPEDPAVYEKAVALAERLHADVILVNDPDCDRMGAAVFDGNGYRLLSGNQIGALLIDYITACTPVNDRHVVITSNVSSPFGKRIAEARGCTLKETLTGFKYIGSHMNTLADNPAGQAFLFGYEESYGYLYGTYAKDKDGVIAALLLACAVQHAKNTGTDLFNHLKNLYEETGYYVDRLLNVDLASLGGREAGQRMMAALRQTPPQSIAGIAVVRSCDYLNGIDTLPPENLLQYDLADGSVIALRPSGTEPLMKCYINARAENLTLAENAAASFADAFQKLVQRTKEV